MNRRIETALQQVQLPEAELLLKKETNELYAQDYFLYIILYSVFFFKRVFLNFFQIILYTLFILKKNDKFFFFLKK